MDNNKLAANLQETLSELPQAWQDPYLWLMNNFDSIAKVCRILNFTEAERKMLWQRATETDNIELMLILETEFIVNFIATPHE